jgi:Lon protease-like protein
VLFPGAVMPLHVFEPRYRALARACVDGDGQLGVVLIERGSEVGGGDVRFSLGTRARIVESAELADGRWVLVLVGVDRVRVTHWLPEEPYPRAEVVPQADVAAGPEAPALRAALEPRLRRALALKAELGEPAAPATIELDEDPGVAAYQAAAAAPFGPADAQRLLAAEGPDDRLRLLLELLDDEVTVLAYRVAGG